VMDRLLRKRPAERYPSAAALITDLERAVEEIHAGITTNQSSEKDKDKGSGEIRRSTSRRERSQRGGSSNIFKRFFG